MAEYGGWTGKILRVDLSTGKVTKEDTKRLQQALPNCKIERVWGIFFFRG